MSTRISRRNSIYGYPNPQAGLQQEPIVSNRDPLTSDSAEIGVTWVNTVSQSYFILCSSEAGLNVWTSASAGSISATSFTVNPGNLTVTAGDVDITVGNLNMAPGSTATVGNLSAGATTLGSTLAVSGNTTIGGTFGVTGISTFSNNVTINGNLVVNGDMDEVTSSPISFVTTSNTDPAISITANGGTTEAIIINSVQGTAADAVQLISTVGGVTLTGGLASVNAINLTATDAAGGMTFLAGTSGFSIGATNGNFLLTTGTGTVSISSDAAATAINIGTGAAVVKTISIGGTGANIIAIGNTQTAGSVAIGASMTGGTITIGGTGLQTGTVSIAPGTGAQAVNIGTGGTGVKTIHIGTGAIDNVITIGTATGAASLSLLSGSGNLSASSTGTLTLSSTGILSVNSSAGAINIGNNAVAQAINIGTGAAARPIIIGNTTASTTMALNTPVGTPVVAANGLSVTTAGRGVSLPGGLLVITGAGDPNGSVTAPIGSLYLNSTGSSTTNRVFINTDAGTTWTYFTSNA